MKRDFNARLALALLTLAALLASAAHSTSSARAFTSHAPDAVLDAAPDVEPGMRSSEPLADQIRINGFFSVDPAQQGSTFQAAIVMEIPRGMHVNSNRPLGKYAVATVLKVDAPRGLRITPVSYPRGSVRTFRFGAGSPEERLAVYEGRAIFRFNVSVPANYELGVARVRANIRFQSCNDEVCFPPTTSQLVLPIAIVGRDTPVNHINGQYFGGAGRRSRG
jgi:hypothetical protein